MHLDRGMPRDMDLFAAGVAGFAAGALLMVLELAWTASMSGDGPWRTTQIVAALTLGPSVLSAAGTSAPFDLLVVTVALITHYVLGIFSGFVVAWVLGALHRVGQLGVAEAVGALFGAAVYFINFHLLIPLVPWFAELSGWGTLIGHVIFGLATAMLYVRLARRGLGQPAAGTA
ncbi:MAG: hypothetical protein HZC37_17185 [Burkholderiales bacterium]|nr:hypothetical protein [Burkholderiales bacterium]